MNISDEKVQEILRNNCGTPPERAKVEYHIWLNEWKYDLALHARIKCNDYDNTLDSFRRLIQAGKDLLKTID